MGCDRELVMFAGLLSFALAFAAMSWLAAAFASFLWFSSLFILRRAAKADPLMRWVYLRQIVYRRYYPPRATPFRVNTNGQGSRYK